MHANVHVYAQQQSALVPDNFFIIPPKKISISQTVRPIIDAPLSALEIRTGLKVTRTPEIKGFLRNRTDIMLGITPKSWITERLGIDHTANLYLAQDKEQLTPLCLPKHTFAEDALVQYKHPSFQLARWMSKELYSMILDAVEYSYIVANPLSLSITQTQKEHNAKKWKDRIDFFAANKWKQKGIYGKTGRHNRSDDLPCIILHKEDKIIISFHGSIGRKPYWDYFPHEKFKGEQQPYRKGKLEGDWGANWDSKAQPANKIIIHDPKEPIALIHYPSKSVHVHHGFARNLVSFQRLLLEEIETIIRSSPRTKFKIFVTGHSKGAAMASLALPMIALEFPTHCTYGFLFSLPKAFNESGAAWATSVLGLENVIRIGAINDIVTHAPFDLHPIGLLAADTDSILLARMAQQELEFKTEHNKINPLHHIMDRPIQFIGTRHYGTTDEIEDIIFHKELVPDLTEIPHNIEKGFEYLAEHVPNFNGTDIKKYLSFPISGYQKYDGKTKY